MHEIYMSLDNTSRIQNCLCQRKPYEFCMICFLFFVAVNSTQKDFLNNLKKGYLYIGFFLPQKMKYGEKLDVLLDAGTNSASQEIAQPAYCPPASGHCCFRLKIQTTNFSYCHHCPDLISWQTLLYQMSYLKLVLEGKGSLFNCPLRPAPPTGKWNVWGLRWGNPPWSSRSPSRASGSWQRSPSLSLWCMSSPGHRTPVSHWSPGPGKTDFIDKQIF